MQIRIAPSLGALEGHPNDIWDTTIYQDEYAPVVFFGLYGLPDFYTLWRHQGKKYILWAGSDIRHFVNGYWLDDEGSMRIDPAPLAAWIAKNCSSWVENEVEYLALKKLGIESHISPSFLGDIDQYEVSFKPSERPKLYTSVSGNNYDLYGWDKIPQLALDNPEVEFHLYGSTGDLRIELPNVIDHGRVPKEVMNEEIKEMQGALRLTEFDGFSEIIAKSLLMGQYPVSLIDYIYCLPVEGIHVIKSLEVPNTQGRDYYRAILNQYPWNRK